MALTLAEEITLLSLDDRTGQTVCGYCTYALSAAMISELVLLGRVVIQGETVRVVNSAAVGDSLLNEAIGKIQSSSGKLTWLIRSPLADHQRDRVLDRLVAIGMLEKVEKKALGLFRYRRYPAHDVAAEAELRQRLRTAVLVGDLPDARTRALLSLADAAGLCGTFLSVEERNQSAGRLRILTEEDPVGGALFVAIRDDDGAAAAAAITVAIT